MNKILEIKDLSVGIVIDNENQETKTILEKINLCIKEGEVHAIMGPNGSGKSTLASVLAGHEDYKILSGEIKFLGQNLLEKDIHERSLLGLFLCMQYPVAIPGVSTINFLKLIVNAHRKHNNQPETDAVEFLTMIRQLAAKIGLNEQFLYRAVNENFSGGEKKRNEILQMMALKPSLAILDELDSGLDIDALKNISHGINEEYLNKKRSLLLITHYQRLLNHIKPDYVHILADGKIIKSGDHELSLKLEKEGYSWLQKQQENL